MSLNQARAIATGLEYFRSLSARCTGSIVWQFNDCWPVVSWSAVDGDGRRKPMYYALRHAYADRLVTLQPHGDGLTIALVNDTTVPWIGTLSVSRRSYEGVVLAKEEIPVEVEPRGTVRMPVSGPVAAANDPARELVLAEIDVRRAAWFLAEDRDSALALPSFAASVAPGPDGIRVTITALTLVRDLALLADRAHPDAEVDDMLATLLPGETVTWTVRGPSTMDPDRLVAPDVLRCANQLVAPPP
jgi:beta-mannosidase